MRFFTMLLIWITCLGFSGIGPVHGEPIKLGALYNITGGMAPIDEPGAKGAKLAVKTLNEKGEVLPGRKLDLEVIDTRTSPEAQKKGAEKLVNIPVVAGIGYGDSDPVLISAPVFQAREIPFLTSGATDPGLPEKIGDYMFMTPFGDNDQAFAMADFAYNELKFKNGVLWTNTSTVFTRNLAKFFKKRWSQFKGAQLMEKKFEGGTRDFSSLIEDVKKMSQAPDFIYIAGNPENAKPTIEQLRRSGIKTPILSGDGFDADLPKLLSKPDYADGIYYTTHVYFGSDKKVVRDFVKAYEKEYGAGPENSFAALGFDSINLLADAIKRAGSVEGPALAKALRETKDYEGVTGLISLARRGSGPVAPVGIIGIKDGKRGFIESWGGGSK